jgi:hypothetical protein
MIWGPANPKVVFTMINPRQGVIGAIKLREVQLVVRREKVGFLQIVLQWR